MTSLHPSEKYNNFKRCNVLKNILNWRTPELKSVVWYLVSRMVNVYLRLLPGDNDIIVPFNWLRHFKNISFFKGNLQPNRGVPSYWGSYSIPCLKQPGQHPGFCALEEHHPSWYEVTDPYWYLHNTYYRVLYLHIL